MKTLTRPPKTGDLIFLRQTMSDGSLIKVTYLVLENFTVDDYSRATERWKGKGWIINQIPVLFHKTISECWWIGNVRSHEYFLLSEDNQ